ncbi:peptide ABC transporter substrate-binding protein [Tepidimicrobium xylanilyticum]|uniref:Oligopeptide transport system substrate-binding protein n=1 Tax=Tepidimicrobium xylanilyticum TaxID=1123352 RepID=A0A1H2RBP3_9FIRM|nr:peptide ABC transporter substrate-binding protein [Tepidimicrobium xylanilyticum]SDW16827.1 oligopeptide transport system substrate-binding protein [Tepidimicrobium xylanilyticum]
MKIKKYLSLFLILTLILTGLVGCGGDSKETGQAAQEGEQVENSEIGIDSEQYLNGYLVAEPSTLDPSKGSDSYSNTVLNNVLEPLTRLEEDENLNNILAPAGAERWDVNEDGTVWTFYLRDNKWSDGEPVTAHDYEYGIKRSLDPNTGSPYAYLLTPIKNAAAVNSGELPVDELGVKALDDKTLEITLEYSTPYFVQLTYQRVMLPQRKDIVEKYGDTYGTEPDTIVYNGPFILTEWIHNSELKFTKNSNYWDAENVKFENVSMKIISDENAIYNSLSNKSIDTASVGSPEWIEKFSSEDSLRHIEIINPSTFYLFFNTKDDVFENANIRKAFSLAIDRQELSNVIFHGIHEPAYGWVPPSISLGDQEYRSVVEGPLKKLAEENPDPKALLIKGLEELGMDTNPENLTVKISLGGTDQWFRTYGEYLQQMYNRNLGVNIEIEQLEWPIFNSNIMKGEFQIGYMGWGAEYNDPASMLSLLKSDSTAIATGWTNERYDELIDLAAAEMDDQKRLEYYREAENILLYEESVVAPSVYPKSNIFRYKYVHGLSATPFGTAGWKYGYTQGR